MPCSSEANQAHPSRPMQRGMIELICGCMFSGKTTALLSRLGSASAESVLLVKHAKDIRDLAGMVSTHDGICRSAISAVRAADIPGHLTDSTRIVAIDEGHFFDPALPDICDVLADRGIDVLIAALDHDMWGRPFPTVHALQRRADSICNKTARCGVCGQAATRTYRLTPIVGKHLVGGKGDFEPRCEEHFTPPPEQPISAEDMD